MGVAGRLVQTAGILALPLDVQHAICKMVELFDNFTPDNDPDGERDFGDFEYAGETIFWRIVYYNKNLTADSKDPADPNQTVRVLTIMLADEY